MNIRADETIYYGETSRFENSCLPLFIRVSDPILEKKTGSRSGSREKKTVSGSAHREKIQIKVRTSCKNRNRPWKRTRIIP